MAIPRLKAESIKKTFGRSTVLQKASLTIESGEIHALIGENGSGKSTLVKILSGYHQPDPGGRITVNGASVQTPTSMARMRKYGVSVLHQDLGLIPDATVADNVRILEFSGVGLTRRISWQNERAATVRSLARVDCDVDPRSAVATLTPSDRFKVAIARALQSTVPGDGVLILDESTRALPKHSLEHLYDLLRGLARSGTSVLLISHSLDEVLELSHKVTILRDGCVVADAESTSGLSKSAIVSKMLGKSRRTFRNGEPASRNAERDVILEARQLTGGRVRGVDVQLRKGAVVGVTGLAGSGFEDLPYLLAGAMPVSGGTLGVAGEEVPVGAATTADLVARRIYLVPEERAIEGLAGDLTVMDNITVPRVGERGSCWYLGKGWQRQEVTAAIEMLHISPANPNALVSTLSGGNQQKVLLAKWILGSPRGLLLHEPTQGVDIGARTDILASIAAQAAQGCAILIATIELELLQDLCDRVLVFSAGRIHRILEGKTTVDRIVEAIYDENPSQFGRYRTSEGHRSGRG